MDNDGKTPGSPDRRDSIRTIQKMINQEDFNQELDQQINAFESGADYKRVPDTNHGGKTNQRIQTQPNFTYNLLLTKRTVLMAKDPS